MKKNLSLQTAYQVLTTILPLITAPYLARVLGAEQLGVFSFTSSIVSYFTLIAMLGTVNYGTRSIAAVKENRQKRSEIFAGIFILQVVLTLFSLMAYIVYLIFICKDNVIISIIQGIAILSCFLDINWLYFGIEDFRLTVTRSIAIRIITVAAILLFVNTSNDLWLYTLIMLGGTFISQVVLWLRIHKIIDFVKPSRESVMMHIKPNIVLFIPLLAMSVYHAMDKTMLGALSTYEQSGFYYNADKVVNIPLCILTGVGTVMLPRMTALFNGGKRKEADDLFLMSLDAISFLGFAMCFGIAAIAYEFIPFFFGNGYDECIRLTIVLSVVIIIKGVSNTVRTQYLVPLEHEKVFTFSVLAGALVNLVVNFALIPRFGALGAVIGTVIAEAVACIWQLFFLKDKLILARFYIDSVIYGIFGMGMFFLIRIIARLPLTVFVKILAEIIIGGSLYIIVTLIYWKITNNKLIASIIKR